MKWKPFPTDRKRKWYFLDDELIHVDELRYRFIYEEIPKSATVFKAIKKKYKGEIVKLGHDEPVYYLDENAKEGGDGTQERPFKHLNDIPSGSNVIVADGIWTCPSNDLVRSVNLSLRRIRGVQRTRLSKLMDEVYEHQRENKTIPEKLLKEIAGIQSFNSKE